MDERKPMENSPVIECSNLTWNPKRCRILPPIQFTMGKELVFLKGGGFGKRVFLELVAGRERACTGEVKVFGQKGRSLSLSPKIAVFISAMKMPEYWTAEECWSFLDKSEDHAAVMKWAVSAGVVADLPLGRLTSADRSLCALACVLAKKADLYLLYEPFFGLDEPMVSELVSLLRKKVENGAAVLVGTSTVPTNANCRIFELGK